MVLCFSGPVSDVEDEDSTEGVPENPLKRHAESPLCSSSPKRFC